MNTTYHIIFCVIVGVIARVSMQNFMKNIKPFSRNIEKYPKQPPEKLKIAQQGETSPSRFLV